MNDPSLQQKRDALTSDVQFGVDYEREARDGATPKEMRQLIRNALDRLGHKIGSITDRERLRRHFDNWFGVSTEASDDQYHGVVLSGSTPSVNLYADDRLSRAIDSARSTTQTATGQEATSTMNSTNATPFFTNKFFVNGRDLALLSKQEIYQIIANKQSQIRQLESISPRPIILQQDIDQQQAELNQLISHLDAQAGAASTGNGSEHAA